MAHTPEDLWVVYHGHPTGAVANILKKGHGRTLGAGSDVFTELWGHPFAGTYVTPQPATAVEYPDSRYGQTNGGYRGDTERYADSSIPGGFLIDKSGTLPMRHVNRSITLRSQAFWKRETRTGQWLVDGTELMFHTHHIILALPPCDRNTD